MTKIAMVLLVAATGCKPNNGTCIRLKEEFPNCSANVRESGCTEAKDEVQFFDESRAAGRRRCQALGFTDHSTKEPEYDIFYFPREKARFDPPPKMPEIRIYGDGSQRAK